MRPALVLLAALFACDAEPAPVDPCSTAAAPSTCLTPTLSAEAYAAAGDGYFDTLSEDGDPDDHPAYADNVVRWEWPPWLLLTGYGAQQIADLDRLVLIGQPGTTVPQRDCRAFDVQPFARCRVVFDYEGKPCPIYEEFTFDAAGRMTWIEAWSDLPGLRPSDADTDPFAEGPDVERLSTRIPGLGTDAPLDPLSDAMTEAAAEDPDIADFVARTQDFWGTWRETFAAAGDDLYERGCGWE